MQKPQRNDATDHQPSRWVLAIVDDPGSAHGARMARALRPTTGVDWIAPTLQLPGDLLAARAGVVALPLRVRGGHRDDRFTAALIEALWRLRARGCLVFVAQGSHPNLLAEAGIAVVAPSGGPRVSASEACVVAAEAAWLNPVSFASAHHG
jgi:hypothetical protein